MKKILLLILTISFLNAEVKDYTFMVGISFGKGDEERTHGNYEMSVSYDFFENHENILLGAAFAYGIADINETRYHTQEYLVKVDYLLDFPFLFSAGFGIGEYELNNHMETRTITSISVTYHEDKHYMFDQYVSVDYRLLDLGTDTSEEVIFIHFGYYF